MPHKILFAKTYRFAKRWVIALVGVTVVLIGIALIVLPGPAIIVIPAGLAILGTEFAWARRWLAEVKRRTDAVLRRNGKGS